jgi:hypothetical protein
MIIEQKLNNPNSCNGCWLLDGKIKCNKYNIILTWDDNGDLIRLEKCKLENSM